MTTVAIMQPTYLPWIGYFDLMDSCDLFIFLDCVQFDKRSWQQRNRIKTANGELFLTVPVFTSNRRAQKIYEVEIDRSDRFATRHLRSVHHSYAKAPFYSEYVKRLTEIMEQDHERLVDLTIALIEWLAYAFGVKTRTQRSSTLPATGAKVKRLVSICKLIGADHYLSPVGARDYIENENLFSASGMQLSYQRYEHPVYRQLHGDFISHLSTIDLLFNEGARLDIIRAGRVS